MKLLQVMMLASLFRSSWSREDCEPLSENILSDILGSAFNPRYMKLKPPVETNIAVVGGANGKRQTAGADPDFFVDDEFSEEISDEPAWAVKFPVERREKRQIPSMKPQWHCESKIRWMDLGPDYYPRFVRTVDCTQKQCWYGKYTCKPKSFTIKILKRRKGSCAPLKDPETLKEVWVWEEKAVNFCCDCVMNSHPRSYY